MDSLAISKVQIWPVDIGLTDPFVISKGSKSTAENLFVCVELQGGAVGYGEVAPFPELTGEDRATSQQVATDLARTIVGGSATNYRKLSREMKQRAPSASASRCGIETALVDAFCHATGVPMWTLWGGADVRRRQTDITIPIADIDRTLTLGREWHQRGFRLFKMKVGLDIEEDVRRVTAVHGALPDVEFVIDANQAFTRSEALEFAHDMERNGCRIVVFEQPVAKGDLDSLAALKDSLRIPIAADESVSSVDDAKALVERQAAHFINLKIMKSGLIEAIEIASLARGHGVRLMIGGMVETRVAMGCSLSLVLGMGGVEVLDLDTPLLMETDPVEAGYRYEGPFLEPWFGAGLGLEVRQPRDARVTTVE